MPFWNGINQIDGKLFLRNQLTLDDWLCPMTIFDQPHACHDLKPQCAVLSL